MLGRRTLNTNMNTHTILVSVIVLHVDVFRSTTVIGSWGRMIWTPLVGRRKPLAIEFTG